jgi:hypothetical protein
LMKLIDVLSWYPEIAEEIKKKRSFQ